MKAIVIAVSVLVLVAGTAVANPIVGEWLYIDFDPPNFAHRADPPIYTSVDAYLMLDLTYSGEPGFASVSFRLDVTPGMSSPPAFTNLLPGDLAIGNWETGITVASTECITTFPAQVAVLTLFYLGVPGDVSVLLLLHVLIRRSGQGSRHRTVRRLWRQPGGRCLLGHHQVPLPVEQTSMKKRERPPDAASVGWPLSILDGDGHAS